MIIFHQDRSLPGFKDLKKIFIRCTWLVVIALVSTSIMAGDSAKLDVIGFSPDSNYFAQEFDGLDERTMAITSQVDAIWSRWKQFSQPEREMKNNQ